MKNFVLLGVAGYIAPRHLNAIKETGNQVIAAFDPHDSVGLLDSYFPEAAFFTEFERLDRHLDLLRRKGTPVDYVTIASPNYLHDSHCRFALRIKADAICEKPVTINPWNIDGLADAEAETGHKVYGILQLRLHPAIIALRKRVAEKLRTDPGHRFAVRLDYVTSRGAWYHNSWKGDAAKSGGIVTNIGIHFFDMLLWIFGEPRGIAGSSVEDSRASGRIDLTHADIEWALSVDSADLPEGCTKRTYRAIVIEGEEVEFSEGFTDLHTESYRQILRGEGFRLADARPSIALVHDIRAAAK